MTAPTKPECPAEIVELIDDLRRESVSADRAYPSNKYELADAEETNAKLLDAIAALAKDAARLRHVWEDDCFDGYASVENDRYDFALEVAAESGRDEPTKDDEFEGSADLSTPQSQKASK